MTNKSSALPKQLVTTALLWVESRQTFLQPGQAYDVDPDNEAQVKEAREYLNKGFLAEPEEIERRRNPEAAAARAEAQKAAQELAGLRAELEQARRDARETVDLRASLKERDSRIATLQGDLQAANSTAAQHQRTASDLQQQVENLQAGAGSGDEKLQAELTGVATALQGEYSDEERAAATPPSQPP
ncbi:hypothetical protein [Deinococcus multiflagellatus]|uniref:Uncharacterized protein n=1 Tax=Deinococcus multiflagellatus TaxID=1656887 RepID=A0ABW1ZTE7_9DEIO